MHHSRCAAYQAPQALSILEVTFNPLSLYAVLAFPVRLWTNQGSNLPSSTVYLPRHGTANESCRSSQGYDARHGTLPPINTCVKSPRVLEKASPEPL
jgi:hypothetical protein